MPPLNTLIQPQSAQAPAPSPAAASATSEKKSAWKRFFQSPEGAAAMIQLGTSLLSGRQIGQAIGDAGGAVNRVMETRKADEQQATENLQRDQQLATQARQVGVQERRAGVEEERTKVLRRGQDIDVSEGAKDRASREKVAGITATAAQSLRRDIADAGVLQDIQEDMAVFAFNNKEGTLAGDQERESFILKQEASRMPHRIGPAHIDLAVREIENALRLDPTGRGPVAQQAIQEWKRLLQGRPEILRQLMEQLSARRQSQQTTQPATSQATETLPPATGIPGSGVEF